MCARNKSGDETVHQGGWDVMTFIIILSCLHSASIFHCNVISFLYFVSMLVAILLLAGTRRHLERSKMLLLLLLLPLLHSTSLNSHPSSCPPLVHWVNVFSRSPSPLTITHLIVSVCFVFVAFKSSVFESRSNWLILTVDRMCLILCMSSKQTIDLFLPQWPCSVTALFIGVYSYP